MPILQTSDTPLYYGISGGGSPVLFVQGVGVTGEGWRPRVNGLSGKYRTMIFDNRGLVKASPMVSALPLRIWPATLGIDG